MCNMLLLASLTILLPLAYPCTDASKGHPTMLEEGALVRLTCPVGQYNELATLMYASGHHDVLLLFSRRDAAGVGRMMFAGGSVAIFFFIYYFLSAIAAGSAVSSGLVVPMLLNGACIGRLFGIMFLAMFGQADVDISTCAGPNAPLSTACYFEWIDPGAFALIGAAAFFGGVSRLTIALTVIMIEITNDVRFLLPIMLSVMVAKWVADSITHSLYHALMEAKCLPFLNPEVTLHGAMDGDLERFTVAQLLEAIHHGDQTVVTMGAGESETFGSVARKLDETTHGAFPVVHEDGRFEGLVSRTQLLAILAASRNGEDGGSRLAKDYLELIHSEEVARQNADTGETRELLHACGQPPLASRLFNIGPFVNSSAFSVRDHFSLHRAYMLFRTMGLRHLTVVDGFNKVVGVVTRRDLMDFNLHDVLHHGDH
jgi:chloride channel 7